MTGRNQVTLPAHLVRGLDLHPGVQIEWPKTPDGGLLDRRRLSRAELAARLAGRGRHYLQPGTDPIRDLVEDRIREDSTEA